MSSSVNILVLGAEGCGKSLLIKRLQHLTAKGINEVFDEIPPTVPTVGNDIVKIKINKKENILREIGGAMAPIWKNYYKDANAVIYVIDKSNQFQISASCIMLLDMLSHPSIKRKNVLLLFNKSDFPSSFSFKQLHKIFRLDDLQKSCDNNLKIVECSCVQKNGFDEIIQWISNLPIG